MDPDFWGFDIPHCRCYDSTGHKNPPLGQRRSQPARASTRALAFLTSFCHPSAPVTQMTPGAMARQTFCCGHNITTDPFPRQNGKCPKDRKGKLSLPTFAKGWRPSTTIGDGRGMSAVTLVNLRQRSDNLSHVWRTWVIPIGPARRLTFSCVQHQGSCEGNWVHREPTPGASGSAHRLSGWRPAERPKKCNYLD